MDCRRTAGKKDKSQETQEVKRISAVRIRRRKPYTFTHTWKDQVDIEEEVKLSQNFQSFRNQRCVKGANLNAWHDWTKPIEVRFKWWDSSSSNPDIKSWTLNWRVLEVDDDRCSGFRD